MMMDLLVMASTTVSIIMEDAIISAHKLDPALRFAHAIAAITWLETRKSVFPLIPAQITTTDASMSVFKLGLKLPIASATKGTT